MNISEFFDPKKTKQLICFDEYFKFFKNLINSNKLPKASLFTGTKGTGKLTLISHLMNSFFDKSNYDEEKNLILNNSSFLSQYLDNIYPNIIYLSGTDFKSVKIDDIRNIKNLLIKKPMIDNKRFVILDDVEMFNLNSMNALLKMIEEPGPDNYFILIYNKSKPLLETIKSRCIEFHINLNSEKKRIAINHLIKNFNQEKILKTDLIDISPGNYIKFNHIFNENKINPDNKFIHNINLILNLYKKEKNILYKDLLIFFTEYYFKTINIYNNVDKLEIIEKRNFLLKNINDFFFYNLSQNSFLQSIENNISNE